MDHYRSSGVLLKFSASNEASSHATLRSHEERDQWKHIALTTPEMSWLPRSMHKSKEILTRTVARSRAYSHSANPASAKSHTAGESDTAGP
uniref:Uncharacterized protein n=1 Tax=Trichuris muris TaxID=70415 RepID=A0A5S6QQE0_TRIMR